MIAEIVVGLRQESFDAAKYTNKEMFSSAFSSGFFKSLPSITACV